MPEHIAESRPPSGWAAKDAPCVMCGSRDKVPGLRKYCSRACARAACRAQRPAVACRDCGDAINAGRERGRSVRRIDVARCVECRVQRQKHGVSAKVLARRDGLLCQLCGETVDMTLRKPDLRSPSIDRIIPTARGGTNDLSNLQLAHLGCNHRKNLLLESEIPFSTCSAPGCDRGLANRAMGLCANHMDRHYRNGTVPAEKSGPRAFIRLKGTV